MNVLISFLAKLWKFAMWLWTGVVINLLLGIVGNWLYDSTKVEGTTYKDLKQQFFIQLLMSNRWVAIIAGVLLALLAGISYWAKLRVKQSQRDEEQRREREERLREHQTLTALTTTTMGIETLLKSQYSELMPLSFPQKPLHNWLPVAPTPSFQAREQALSSLQTHLFSKTSTQPYGTSVGIIGMGGIGKTQLAAKFTQLYSNRFPDGCFWITNTEDPHFDWYHAFAMLALNVEYLPKGNVPTSSERERVLARSMCRYVAEHPHALLILDNVQMPDALSSLLQEMAGAEWQGTILYTSRSDVSLPGGIRLPVEPFSDQDAFAFLLKEARPKLFNSADLPQEQMEVQTAFTICQHVGNLPLALTHLRTLLLKDPKMTLKDLEEALQQRGAIALTNLAQQWNKRERSLYETFSLNWDQLHNLPQRLFKLACYFPEAMSISPRLLAIAAGFQDEQSTILNAFGGACIELCQWHLLEEDLIGGFRMHPLVREFGRTVVLQNHDGRFLTRAGQYVRDAFANLTQLEQIVRSDGYWQCLDQVRNTARYVAQLDPSSAHILERIASWLLEESSLLGNNTDWQTSLSALFYQQLSNRAVDENHMLRGSLPSTPWLRLLKTANATASPYQLLLLRHPDAVTDVAYLSEGSSVVTRCNDGSTWLWNALTGQLISSSQEEKNTEILSLWKLSRGWRRIPVKANSEKTKGVIITDLIMHEGKKLVARWTNTFLLYLEQHKEEDFWQMFSGEEQEKEKVFALVRRQSIPWQTLFGHTRSITSACFSPDGEYIVSGSADQTARVWRVLQNKSEAEAFNISPRKDFFVFLLSEHQAILIQAEMEELHIWDIAKGVLIETYASLFPNGCFFPGSRDNLHLFLLMKAAAVSSDGTKLIVIKDAQAVIWNIHEKTYETNLQVNGIIIDEKRSIPSLDDQQSNVVFSPDGAYIATSIGRMPDAIALWNTTTGALVALLDESKSTYALEFVIQCLGFSDDGSRLVSGSWSGYMELWDAKRYTLLASQESSQSAVTSLSFVPSRNEQIITGHENGFIKLWNVQCPHIVVIAEQNEGSLGGPVRCLRYSPDSRYLAAGHQNGYLCIWCIKEQSVSFVGFCLLRGNIRDICWYDVYRLVVATDEGGSPNYYHIKLEGV
jgi:WD40 repeat protein